MSLAYHLHEFHRAHMSKLCSNLDKKQCWRGPCTVSLPSGVSFSKCSSAGSLCQTGYIWWAAEKSLDVFWVFPDALPWNHDGQASGSAADVRHLRNGQGKLNKNTRFLRFGSSEIALTTPKNNLSKPNGGGRKQPKATTGGLILTILRLQRKTGRSRTLCAATGHNRKPRVT